MDNHEVKDFSCTNCRLLAEVLIELNGTYAAILERITDSFYALDRQWCYIYLNRQTENMLGKKREELLGKCLWEVYPRRIGTALWSQMLRAMKEKTAVHFEAKSFFNNNMLEYHVYPSSEGLSVFCRNLSQQKELEQKLIQLDRFHTIGQVAACLGHELRNPLAALRGSLQLLGNAKLIPQHKELLQMSLAELDRANSILSQFLLIGRTNSFSPSLSLNMLIEQMVPVIQAEAGRDGKIVEVCLGEIPGLDLDEEQIRQLIINLVRNGLESMGVGGRVTICTYTQDKYVVLGVRDQGTGIQPGVLADLGKSLVSTKPAGAGLGLMVCYGIAARHGAVIVPMTGPGGTTVNIRFAINGC